MTKDIFHPGRRKRQRIMKELAAHVALKTTERLTSVQLQALDALLEMHTSFSGSANRRYIDTGVLMALDVCRNTARGVVDELTKEKLVNFQRTANGCVMTFPDSVIDGMSKLHELERAIEMVTLVEDGIVVLDISREVELLKANKIYVEYTDADLDQLMKDNVYKEIEKQCEKELAAEKKRHEMEMS